MIAAAMIYAAIYARRSPGEVGADADTKSVQRQTEAALTFAAARGWTVLPEHIYTDDGLRGSETHKLVTRQRLLDTIHGGAPFEALIIRDTSRFSRRDGDEAFGELKTIDQAGVEVWFYQESTRFTHGTFGDNVVGFVKAEAAADYRRQIAAWTRAAMEQKARKGYVTGGRCFGYDNVRVNGHVERRINEVEAAIVVRIFELAAGGAGVKRVAQTLNAERAPCPRAQQGRPHGWAPSSVRCVLRRDLYRGLIVWGRTKQRDGSGEHRYQQRPPAEWVTVPAPEARIVSDELWERAHRRLKAAAATYLRGTNGRLWGRPPTGLESRYLLTGLSRCATCGSGMMAHSRSHGRQRWRYYVCTGFHNRGRTVCPNSLPLPMREADAAVLAQLRDYVLQPDVIEGAILDAVARLRPQAETVEAQRAELRVRLQTVNEELARLAAAIAGGGELPSLLAAGGERERQRARLEQEVDSLDGLEDVAQLDVRRIEKDLRAKVKDWRGLLRRQVPVSRQIVTKLLDDRLVFTPRPENRSYEFAGRATLGKFLQGVVLPQVWRPQGDWNPCLSLERADGADPDRGPTNDRTPRESRPTAGLLSAVTSRLRGLLEDGQRVERRAGAAFDRQGGRDQHELPSVQPRGGLGERFEVLVVEQVHTHRHDRQQVHRQPNLLDLRRYDVRHPIAAEERHVPRLDPWHRRGVEAGCLLGDGPRADIRATSPAAGADEQGIARSHRDTRHLFPGLEILHVDRRPGLEIRHPFEARNVDQHATSHDAAL